MPRSLGSSDGPRPPTADDPQRLARQAIRSQAAAREYAERQLLRAEQTIEDLCAKFHSVRRERDAAVAAARIAQAAQAQAERGLRAVEAALIREKAISGGAQREVQEARATVHNLRTKLALANQTAEALRTRVAPARPAPVAPEPAPLLPRTPAVAGASVDAPGDQPVKRTRGRAPGKREASAARPPAPKARESRAANQAPVRWWADGWTPPA